VGRKRKEDTVTEKVIKINGRHVVVREGPRIVPDVVEEAIVEPENTNLTFDIVEANTVIETITEESANTVIENTTEIE